MDTHILHLCTVLHLLQVEKFFYCVQCDQIGRFIGLWATFESLWQQLICTKISHIHGQFFKGVKIYNFSSEIIFG